MKTFKTMTPEQKSFMLVTVFICMAVYGLFTGLLARWDGIDCGVESMKREAVQKNHAEYKADAEGKPKWVWK